MYNFPFKLDNYDQIIKSLQIHCKKLLDCTDPYAESIQVSELKNIVPELFDQFEKLKIELDVARFYVTPPGYVLPIHRDGSPENEKFWAFNLPIYNCINTSMMWYKVNGTHHTVDNQMYSPKPVRIFNTEECTEIYRCEINTPMWVQVNIPHSVNNPTNTGNRIIISMRFFDTPLEWHPSTLIK